MAEGSNEQYDMAKDPNRKAKSLDPAWKYGFWPDLNKKDMIQCTLCNKRMHAGVRRLKHLAGNCGDVVVCPKTTPAIMKEMKEYMVKGSRKTSVPLDDDDDEEEIQEIVPQQTTSTCASNTI